MYCGQVVVSDVLGPGSRIQEALTIIFFAYLSDVFCSDAVLHLVISFAICQAGGKISLLSVFEFRLIFAFFEYQIVSLVRFSCTFGMQCKLNMQIFM